MAEDDLDPEEGHIEDSDLVKIVAQLGDQLLPKVLEVTRVLRLDIGDSKSWVRTWASKIVSGDLEAAACLLIALLPNLEKLRIVDDWRFYDSPPFYSTLDRLLNATTDSNYHLTGLNSFKYLSEVGVHGSDDGAGGDFDVGPIFDALPSIRTIKGWSIDGVLESPGQACKARLPVEPDSEITNLEFYQSSISTVSFYRCIKKIKSLQKFTYDFHDFCADTTEEQHSWESRGVVGVLQSFASRSLVHLELTGVTTIHTVKFRRGEPFIGSLRAFEVLETLRLETVMLYKEVECTDDENTDDETTEHETTDGDTTDDETLDGQCGTSITAEDRAGGHNALVEPERLVDFLPASAKRLRLVGELSNEEAMAMLEDVVELKDKRIPNLRRIFFEDLYPLSEISSTCEEARVKVRFCARV